jgi:2-keto-4-pentenoate hydratase/2-oxohepta-3-ene-1,7-dioic acid hydratase in catechol pathway
MNMRLLTYRRGRNERLGFLINDTVVDLHLALPTGAPELSFFNDAIAFIRSGKPARDVAERSMKSAPPASRLPLASVELVAPMRPTTILCSGSNYRDHNAEKANTPISGKEPEFFIKTGDSVIGLNEPIVYDPEMSRKIDCETELAVVIGKPGRHIPVASALDHVFGYTIVNDVTARDRQVPKSPDGSIWYELGRGKSFDSSAPLGPMIVTADEIGDPQALNLKTRINGELRRSSNTGNMIWSCADLVHFFSTNFTLHPRDDHYHWYSIGYRLVHRFRVRRKMARRAGARAGYTLLSTWRCN